MAIKKKTNASFWICAVGLVVVAAAYIYWVLTDNYVAKAGYLAGTVSVVIFTAVCLRFVPVWMKFWNDGTETAETTERPQKYETAKIFALFIIVDVVVIGLTCLFRYFVGEADNIQEALEFWYHLDAARYLAIAEKWYPAPGEPDAVRLVFFPGYPLLTRFFKFFIGSNMYSGLLASSLCHAGSACMLYKTLLLDYPRDCARRTVKYLAILPAAFFFSAPMSESLFIFMSICAVYFTRRGKWGWAGLFGGLSAFTRSMGVLVFAFVFIEAVAVCRKQGGDKKKWALNFASLLLIPMGILAYFAINYQVAGDCFKFMDYQKNHWGQGFGLFFDVLAKQADMAYGLLFTPDYSVSLGAWIPNTAYSLAALLLFLLVAKKIRPGYTAWFIAYFVIAMGATSLQSGPRYLVGFMPIYPALAELLKNKKFDRIFGIICLPIAVFYLWACTMHWGVY